MRKVLATAAITALGMAGIGAAVSPAKQDHSPDRKCFPLIEWNAEPGLRPCARITRLYEDGSLKVAVSDARGTVRYSAGVGAADR